MPAQTTKFCLPTPATSAVLVLDVQERLAAAMATQYVEGAIRRITKLIRAARALRIPVIATENNPGRIGPTLPVVAKALGDNPVIFESTPFDRMADPRVAAALAETERHHLIVCGIETHIAVVQTAVTANQDGWRVFVPADATLARARNDYRLALDFMACQAITVLTFEALLYAWFGATDSDAFLKLSHLTSERDD